MRKIIVMLAVLVVIGVILTDVDGGWFQRRSCPPGRCGPQGPQGGTPPAVDIPIEQLILDVPGVTPGASLSDRVEELENTIVGLVEAYNTLPPVIMEIQHPDGTVYTQSKPLGEAIRLRLVPQ